MEFLSEIRQSYMVHAAHYNRSFVTMEEFNTRLEQYKLTDDAIKEFNAKPNQTSTVGHNKFSDWSPEEH